MDRQMLKMQPAESDLEAPPGGGDAAA